MKKQYTVEEAYEGNTKITFYINGEESHYVIIENYNLMGYLCARQEDGWVEAYSYQQMKELANEIKSLEEELALCRKQLEVIKNNLIGE